VGCSELEGEMTSSEFTAAVAAVVVSTDRELLKRLCESCRDRASELDAQLSRNFSRGDRVQFRKGGLLYSGVVEKVNRKRLRVKADEAMWNVPAGMLTFSS
jgi:hypothetical protein